MIIEIPEIKMPKWLLNDEFHFNVKNILTDSLYYPSCYIDGTPIQCLMGNIYSFVYVDYGLSENNFLCEINKPYSFKGYNIIHKEKILKGQLDNGVEITFQEYISKMRIPERWVKKPYCYWIIFERDINYNDDHNPKRFSLLFLCSEGVLAYYVLYNKNRIAPKILCIIQDGSGFGCNWTSYTDRDKYLARAVFANKNLPEYLINGGYGYRVVYEKPIWPEYTNKKYDNSDSYNYRNGRDDNFRGFTLWEREGDGRQNSARDDRQNSAWHLFRHRDNFQYGMFPKGFRTF